MESPDPILRRAATPPGAVYTDPAAYARVVESVFSTSWQVDTMSPPRSGRARPWTLLEGSLDEPLLWSRDAAGELRCLSNVCTHRAALVCSAEGSAETLRCPYHGRRFRADGTLAAAPGFDGAADFPTERDDLPSVAHAAWGPLGFARLAGGAGALGLHDALAPLTERVGHLDPAAWSEDPASRRTHHLDANWMLYCENYLEGWHVPFVHPGLARAIDLAAYEVRPVANGVLQTAYARDDEAAFDPDSNQPDSDQPDSGHPKGGRRVAAWYFLLFPNTMLNVYPWGLSLNRVRPLGPTACAIDYAAFVRDPSLREQGAGADLDQVEAEDQAIVRSAQRGLRSRLYRGGRYAPQHEAGVHHFHRWIAERAAPRGD